MIKVLVVEDNKVIANNIKKYLELDGFNVIVVENGLYALEVVKHKVFDVILLDLMLPGVDGITIAKTIKEFQNSTPIIMITAKGQLDDKLDGFSSGADDYLVKPFDMQELVARIQAVMKRVPNRHIFEYKDIVLQRDMRKVYKDGVEIKFTLKEYLILEMLFANIGIAVSRTDIISEIWGSDSIFDEDAKLDVYLSNLRKKLGKELIETVKGFGYRVNQL